MPEFCHGHPISALGGNPRFALQQRSLVSAATALTLYAAIHLLRIFFLERVLLTYWDTGQSCYSLRLPAWNRHMQKSLIILGPFALLWVASLFLLGHSQNQCFFAFDGPPREAWCGYMDLLFLGTSVAFTAGILFASYRAIMGGRSFRPIGLALILIGNALFATGWFALRLPMLITFFTDRSFFTNAGKVYQRSRCRSP